MKYEKNGVTVELNQSLADKIKELVSCGLVEGVGKPEPGKMCVEAAVNYACGFEHGDDPVCVGAAVRSFKIRLNDSAWSSDKARGEGMRDIAVAQLGSDTLDQVEFAKRIALKTVNVLICELMGGMGFKKEAKECKEAKTLDAASDAASYAASAASDAASYAASYAVSAASDAASYAVSAASDAASYAASYAASAASDAASAASDAASYAVSAARAASYAASYAASAARAENPDKWLLLGAKICLDVLKEMKSPGCKWL